MREFSRLRAQGQSRNLNDMKDRSAWNDRTELKNEHQIVLRATKTAIRSEPNATRLDARSRNAIGGPARNGSQRANAWEVKGSNTL